MGETIEPNSPVNGNHIHKTQLSKHITQAHSTLVASDYTLEAESLTPESADNWSQQKIERNAITAILIGNVFENFLALAPTRSPFGVLERDYHAIKTRHAPMRRRDTVSNDNTRIIRTPKEIFDNIGYTLKNDLKDYFIELKSRPDSDPEKRSYLRLENLTKAIWEGKTNDKKPSLKTGAEHFINRGLGTALDVMYKTQLTIPLVYKTQFGRFPTAKEFLAIAKNSFGVVSKLASGHINVNLSIIESLKPNQYHPMYQYTENTLDSYDIGSFAPENFFIIEAGSERKMIINNDLWNRLIREHENKELDSETTGCPALTPLPIALGGDRISNSSNVIKGMWDFSIDILQKMYPSTQTVPPLPAEVLYYQHTQDQPQSEDPSQSS